MLQFTQEQIKHFPNKPNVNEIKSILKDKIDAVEGNFIIPPSKAATWSGFYACPKHSTRLVFDINSPKAHLCPVDNEMIVGEVYDGAWWRILNNVNEQAAHSAALLHLLDRNPENLELAKKYLLAYAKVYPGYEVHGDIPYNNPGKANAQTLCDAGWIKGLLFTYDIIKEDLSKEEQQLIEEDLFRCCGNFLMEYRSNQIHNHEMVINTAIAMIGLLLNDAEMISFGISKPYGMQYQLDHGLLSDGFWFEGSIAYHYYMIEQIIFFEMFAKDTQYSFFKNEKVLSALKFPLNLLDPTLQFPLLNDTGSGYKGLGGLAGVYELAYAVTKDADILKLLCCVYKNQERVNADAFFFGVDSLERKSYPSSHAYNAIKEGSSGITTLEGDNGFYLLIKHAPFGGEHDHYDRLGIHFMGYGINAIPDIGTSLYGAPMHYNYYKNTASHNTVCLNGYNQPPANCTVNHYEKNDKYTVLDSSVSWDGSYVPMETHVISQWNDEAYEGASFRRIIVWYGSYFIDIFLVNTPQERCIDYTLHMRGILSEKLPIQSYEDSWASHGAGTFLYNIEQITPADTLKSQWTTPTKEIIEVQTLLASSNCNFYGLGPDNPSTNTLSYYLQRKVGKDALFINIVSMFKQNERCEILAATATYSENQLSVTLETRQSGTQNFTYTLS